MEFETEKAKLRDEIGSLIEERNFQMDRNLKIEETIDAKNEDINQLEKEL